MICKLAFLTLSWSNLVSNKRKFIILYSTDIISVLIRYHCEHFKKPYLKMIIPADSLVFSYRVTIVQHLIDYDIFHESNRQYPSFKKPKDLFSRNRENDLLCFIRRNSIL